MTKFDTLNEILKNEEVILQGGKEYETWAISLLKYCITSELTLEYGGLLIPQFGKLTAVDDIDNSKEKLSNDKRFKDIINKCYESDGVLTPTIFKLNETSDLILSPVSHGFERPIGYYWIICKNNFSHKLKCEIDYASTLLSLCVKSKKTSFAIEQISNPLSIKFSNNFEGLLIYSIEILRKTISCFGIVIWLSEKKYLVTKYADFEDGEFINLDMKVGEGFAGRSFQNNETIIIDDLWKHVQSVKHLEVVHQKNLRSGVFIPLTKLSNKVEGVIAFYGERPFAFSKIDVSIAQAIIQHLNINLSEKEWINNIAAIKRKIDNEMPLIEAGILAMEKIHDAKNKLNFAQDKLNDITAWYYDRKESKVYKNSSDAGSFIADAQEILVELVKRSKLNKSNLKTISLNNFINEIIETHLPECIPYKIEVIFKKYSDDIFVTIDKSLFKRVFHNLFDNSIHFLKDSRSQRTIKISSDKANSNALIIFSDSGPGIAPSNLDEVFDMFYTSKGEKGMGFGLAIVKRIIEDHDGSIEVKSKWGFNTEFTIKLPIK